MTEAKINVYRRAGAWCYAAWIAGEYDHSDTLDIAADASLDEALQTAKEMPLRGVYERIVERITDVS